MFIPRTIVLALILLPLLVPEARADGPADAQALEFFEKEVRPLLADRCQKCHGPKVQKGELRLDSRAAALKGGQSGPAVVPGRPEESLLVDAINYGDLVQMPPKSRLPDAEVATFTRWVALGAPWPEERAPSATSPATTFDLNGRARHWSFRPLRDPAPPEVRDAAWPLTTVDRFLLAALETQGLAPAPDADRRSLLRRVTYDLTGLPPTPGEVAAFLADGAPDAFDRVVDRLLASPHYGERWGRHWLDLVRFAETSGHEFDYEIPGAFRYRDYVVRALNADLPYDRFVVEHVAGDLLDAPRRHPTEGFNESVLGTGFFLLGEGTHSPVDVREDQVRRIDNQIDVFAKAFLGLTVACARCHDHKFDPIATKDYYALAGYLRSSRYQHAFIDPPGRIGPIVADLRALKARIGPPLPAPSEGVGERLLAALGGPEAKAPDHPLHALAPLAAAGPWADRLREAREALRDTDASSTLFEGFDSGAYDGWSVSGDAFGARPSRLGDWRIGPDGPVPVAPGQAHSGLVADRLQGVLRSRTFRLDRPRIHYLASGRGGRINLVVDGLEKIRDPIYGGLTLGVDSDAPRWYEQDVAMWLGHDAYIEIADGATVDFTQSRAPFRPGDGFIAVDEIRFADGPPPPSPLARLIVAMLDRPEVDSPEAAARALDRAIGSLVEEGRAGRLVDPASIALVVWLMARGLLPARAPSSEGMACYREDAARIPEPTLALALADGTGLDERVMVRGNYRTPGEVVPRRFLEVLAGPDQPAPGPGSGRLDLARRMVDPARDPLLPRVLVNRLWQHHFGEGIVRSPDDFGAMGQPPSHPDLLDHLAAEFLRGGWSIKRMHRLILRSHAYRMASRPVPDAERADPTNRLLHRMNVRRLEAEALRDAILAVSGRLDRAMGGPSVAVHLTPFMEGRGRPARSGPLDGDGRRSLYLMVRRNFLNPMFLAFDFPAPATTMGRRNVSNVPAQALTLLNDPFVVEQARRWADRLLADPARSTGAMLNEAYTLALGRPPDDDERAEALGFLEAQARLYGSDRDPRAWADLGHVLWNTKGFLFLD